MSMVASIAKPARSIAFKLRHLGYPNHLAIPLLDAAALPKPVDKLIRQTISKSKLWANERAEIARELIAHTQDAIESGKTEEEIVKSFGDPKRVAKLMRRSMKRKRPLYWRAYRNMKRATAAMTVVLVLGYGGLAMRFYVGKPSIKRNHIVEMNGQNNQYQEDQKAWAVYHDVGLQWQRHIRPTLLRQQARYDLEKIEHRTEKYDNEPMTVFEPGLTLISNFYDDFVPGHPDYEETLAVVKAFEPELARVRRAANRPIVGMPFTDTIERVEIEPGIWEDQFELSDSNPALQGSLIEVLLPNLGIMRGYSGRFVRDAKWAFKEGDSQRATADYLAIAGMARQVMQQGLLISDLVGFTMLQAGQQSLSQNLVEFPGALSKEQLISIAHVYSLAGQELGLHVHNERRMFDDILQRAYTDNGSGNGRMTLAGYKLMSSWDSRRKDNEGVLEAVTKPLSFLAGDRQSQHNQYHNAMDMIEQVVRDGPESLWRMQLQQANLSSEKAELNRNIYSPFNILFPGISKAADRFFQTQLKGEAFLTVLAIEAYQRDHGQLPGNLEELATGYLPQVPQDPFNPGYPIQYKVDESGYFLYVAGSDGDLDAGVEPISRENSRMHLGRRFRANIHYVSDPIGPGRWEVARDDDGGVILLDPDGPDSDWILIDMRSKLEPTSDE